MSLPCPTEGGCGSEPLYSNPLTEGASADEVLSAAEDVTNTIGLIPGIGEPFDLASGVISFARGDKVGFALSVAAVVPFAGDAPGAAKLARRLGKAADALDAARDAKRAFNTITDKTVGNSVSNIATSTNATQAAKTLIENGHQLTRVDTKTFLFSKGGQKTYGINFRGGQRGATLEKYVPGRKKARRKIRLSQP